MSGATDHLPRLLALVPWLLAHPGTPIREVATRFGIDEDQVRKDLDLLWMCGLPGHGPGDLMDVVYDGDRVWLSNADTIARPLRLAADEALALVAALRALRGVPGLADTAAVDGALAKLEAAAGAAAAVDDVVVAPEPAGDPDVVATATGALQRGRVVRMTYWVPARDEATERDVDPIRLLTSDGVPYLLGWCRRVEDVRTFRLDRVLSVSELDEPARVPEEVRQRALDAGLFSAAPDDRLVTMHLQPAGRWVADYYPCETVEEHGDGGLVVTLRARDDDWVRRLALTLAGVGHLVAPDDLVVAVRADARAALSGYPPNARSD